MSEEDEDGSFFDNLSDKGDTVQDTLTTDPSEWSQEQIVGVAVGSTVGLFVILFLWWCCQKRCRCCGRSSTTVNPRHKLDRPYVTKATAKNSPKMVNTSNKLPLGAMLHGAEKLHVAGLDGRNVRVAVIDSGIDKNHPGFDGLVVKQEWYRLGTPLADDDHGTHVAGTIHFMAPKAAIYDYRVFGDQGKHHGDIAISMAIRQAVYDGCHIINMSLRASYPIVTDVREAVEYAHSRGVVMVCTAGNSGSGDPTTNDMFTYPAKWKETISVAAVRKTSDEPVAYFSESSPVVDFAAVGVNVTSLQPGGGFQTMNGTSMAGPHVSGFIAALMTNGAYRNKYLKLRKDLETKYAIDIVGKGKDKSTSVGFLTFLSQTEFDTFWVRYAGLADKSSESRIRAGTSDKSSRSRVRVGSSSSIDKSSKKKSSSSSRGGRGGGKRSTRIRASANSDKSSRKSRIKSQTN